MKYRAIRDHADRFPIRLMTRALSVSPAGYYAWRMRPQSDRARRNQALLIEIRALHAQSRHTYGSPRITRDLEEMGHPVGENRVARLMQAHGIRAKTVKKWKATTDSSHRLPVASNTLDRQFMVTAPNHVWAGDFSYIWTQVPATPRHSVPAPISATPRPLPSLASVRVHETGQKTVLHGAQVEYESWHYAACATAPRHQQYCQGGPCEEIALV